MMTISSEILMNDISCEPLTYWEALSSQVSSAYSLIGDASCTCDGFGKASQKKRSLSPYLKVVDFNNSNGMPYDNKPKKAVEVGLRLEF